MRSVSGLARAILTGAVIGRQRGLARRGWPGFLNHINSRGELELNRTGISDRFDSASRFS